MVPQGLAVFWDDQVIQDSGEWVVSGDLVPDQETIDEDPGKYLPVAVFDNFGKMC